MTDSGSARKTSATGFITSDKILRRVVDEWGAADGGWPEGSFPQDPVTALGSSSPVDSPPPRVYAQRVIRGDSMPRRRSKRISRSLARVLSPSCQRCVEAGESEPGDRRGRRVGDQVGEELTDRRCELEAVAGETGAEDDARQARMRGRR